MGHRKLCNTQTRHEHWGDLENKLHNTSVCRGCMSHSLFLYVDRCIDSWQARRLDYPSKSNKIITCQSNESVITSSPSCEKCSLCGLRMTCYTGNGCKQWDIKDNGEN